MELLDDSIVPEHARGVKAEAREFAREHIEPNAREYFQAGEYPRGDLEAGQEADLVAGTFRRSGAAGGSIWRSCSRSRKSSTGPTRGSR